MALGCIESSLLYLLLSNKSVKVWIGPVYATSAWVTADNPHKCEHLRPIDPVPLDDGATTKNKLFSSQKRLKSSI